MTPSLRTLLAVLFVLSFAALTSSSFAQNAAAPAAPAEQPATFELRDGDRVAFIGGTFFEREYNYGLIETALTVAHPDKQITFRNLGWSGDTVWGEARAYFGKPDEGYANLLADVALANPTVIFLAYGANESFAGPDGLPAFTAQYNKLLDDLKPVTSRIVVLTPLPQEAVSSPLPKSAVEQNNANVSLYAGTIIGIAERHNLTVFDLHDEATWSYAVDQEHLRRTYRGDQLTVRRKGPYTEDGSHLSEHGYRHVSSWLIYKVFGPAANHTWSMYLVAADFEDTELQEAVLKKNQLFFHRWRPANITYLTLFRKHEQGNNAVELGQFDPLIEQAERDIADLRAKLTSASDEAAPAAVPVQPAPPANPGN